MNRYLHTWWQSFKETKAHWNWGILAKYVQQQEFKFTIIGCSLTIMSSLIVAWIATIRLIKNFYLDNIGQSFTTTKLLQYTVGHIIINPYNIFWYFHSIYLWILPAWNVQISFQYFQSSILRAHIIKVKVVKNLNSNKLQTTIYVLIKIRFITLIYNYIVSFTNEIFKKPLQSAW